MKIYYGDVFKIGDTYTQKNPHDSIVYAQKILRRA